MAVSEEYLNHVIDQLSEFGEVEIKRMFGGIGLFYKGLMFGKIGSDVLRLKVDEFNEKEYEDRGMKPFYSEKKKKGMPYWEVPTDILKNKDKLKEWTLKSYEAAVRAKK